MKQILPVLLLFVAVSLRAQLPERELPRFLTDAEVHLKNPGVPAGSITSPPSLPVRAMAEWEELQALVITWRGQNAILAEIVRHARLECEVIVNCNSANDVSAAKTYLTNKNIDLSSRVTFLVNPNNTIWVRDYGPNCVYANDVDSLYLVDWIYNRPRPMDDGIGVKIAENLKVPLYSTALPPYDLVHTGGNFMSDGMGLAFSSELVFDENGPNNQYGQSNHSEAAIDEILNEFMGIKEYAKMEPLPYDVIHHIDMHMKLLDEQTLLVGEYPVGTADGPQIEANIQYLLDNFKTSFGTPFKVVRIPMPPENGAYPNNGGDYRTYANAVFVNKTVLVPFYETKFDTTAQRIWETALPGYKIVGINCNAIIPSLGAIHCITKEIGVPQPLRIVHQALEDQNQLPGTAANYPVEALIQHISGIKSASVWWSTNPAGPWQEAAMTALAGGGGYWKGEIPVQAPGAIVYYYIEASALNGKKQVRPLPAPAGWWKFKVNQFISDAPEPGAPEMLRIYPNPASARTVVPVLAHAVEKGTVRMYDVAGRLVATLFEGDFSTGINHVFFHATDFPSGIYLVEVRTESGVGTRQVAIR